MPNWGTRELLAFNNSVNTPTTSRLDQCQHVTFLLLLLFVVCWFSLCYYMTNGPCARNYDIGRLNQMLKCTIKRYTNARNICALFFFAAFAILSLAFVYLRAIAYLSHSRFTGISFANWKYRTVQCPRAHILCSRNGCIDQMKRQYK